MAQLQQRSGENSTHEFHAGPVSLGRDESCDVVVDDPEASRVHARLDLIEGQWRITDLGSSNGTFLNQERVAMAPLRSGDDIRIGQATMTFRTSTDPKATLPSKSRTPEGFELTTREREVLSLVADGHTDRKIAELLTINVSTVQSHLDRIRDKTGCRRRAELTRWALKNNIA